MFPREGPWAVYALLVGRSPAPAESLAFALLGELRGGAGSHVPDGAAKGDGGVPSLKARSGVTGVLLSQQVSIYEGF